jgi:hypothetical protein
MVIATTEEEEHHNEEIDKNDDIDSTGRDYDKYY